jgi:hypothetical protein
MEEKKRKITIEINRSLGRRLDIYIERWNEIHTPNPYSEDATKDNIIQALLTEKLEDIRELIIDYNGEKRAYYAEIDIKGNRAFGSVLYSHGMINFESGDYAAGIDQAFESVVLRYERFAKVKGRSYVIIG